MSVKVLQPGFYTTVQDLGRFGLQKYGIVVGGAMDTLALRIGNILVGNDENEAGLEVTLFGTKLEFTKDYIIAITGGELNATLNNEKVEMWRPHVVQRGDVLTLETLISGCRAYISISGGFNVREIMGSKSTYTDVNIGGYKGRPLERGDVLHANGFSVTSKKIIQQLDSNTKSVKWFVNFHQFYSSHLGDSIRITLGSEFDYFNRESKNKLFTETFKVTPNSNRMGYQLKGSSLSLKNDFELLSEGVTFGTIQVPSKGQPIILMADRQTTGGYPKIGQVISVDLPRLAQFKPGDSLNFQPVSISDAENLLIQREENLHRLKLIINHQIG